VREALRDSQDDVTDDDVINDDVINQGTRPALLLESDSEILHVTGLLNPVLFLFFCQFFVPVSVT